jgi:hypothetical protein
MMKKLTGNQIGMILAGLATAVLHLAAAFDKVLFPEGVDPLFILNGLGYLGLLGAYFLPIPFFQQKHKLVWWVLIGFALLTIVAWLVIWIGFSVIRDGTPFFSRDSWYGVPAKIAEVLLLVLLRLDQE